MNTQPLDGLSPIFYVYFSVAVLASAYSLFLACQLNRYIAFTLMIALGSVVAFDNLTVGIVIDRSNELPDDLLRTRFAMQSFLVPIFLVTMFELNYEVHKERSANFFGCITFDDGKRTKNTVTSQFIRYSIWIVSFALVILGIIGAAQFIVTPAEYVQTSRYSNGALERADADRNGVSSLTELLDYVPQIMLVAFSIYTGLSLWRYGTTISVDVRANWLYLTALLLTPSSLGAPYYVNGALLLMQLALVGTSRLIATNLVTLKTEAQFLAQLGSGMGVGEGLDEAEATDDTPYPRFRVGGGVLRASQAEMGAAGGGGVAPGGGGIPSQQSASLASGQAVGATGMPLPPLSYLAGQYGVHSSNTSSEGVPAADSGASAGAAADAPPASPHGWEGRHAAASTLGAAGLDAMPHSPTMPMRGEWAHTHATHHKRSASKESQRSRHGGGAAEQGGGFRRYRLGARLARYGSSAMDLDAPANHSYDVRGGVSSRARALLGTQGTAPPAPPQRHPAPPPASTADGLQVRLPSAGVGMARHVSFQQELPPPTPPSLGAALAHSSPEDDSDTSSSSGDDASPDMTARAAAWRQQHAHSAPVTPRRAAALRSVRSLRLAPQEQGGNTNQAGRSQKPLEFYRAAGARGRSGAALRAST